MEQLPELESGFRGRLEKIIEDKCYDGEEWEEQLYPQVIARLNQLRQAATNETEIEQVLNKILNHLARHFTKYPPFTIVRFAELLVELPYKLNSVKNLLKYFNSLCRSILVCSNITEFAPVTFQNSKNAPIEPVLMSQTINVSLVEIPWLKKDDKSVDTPKQPLLEIPLSPRRRREDEEEDEEDSKRPKHDSDSPSKISLPKKSDHLVDVTNNIDSQDPESPNLVDIASPGKSSQLSDSLEDPHLLEMD